MQMTIKYNLILLIILLGCKSTENSPQTHSYWQSRSINEGDNLPLEFGGYLLNKEELISDIETTNEVDLPTPNNSYIRLKVKLSNVMSQELSEKFPSIKSYTIYNSENSVTGNLDVNPSGVFAMINTGGTTFFINPVTKKSNEYICYDKQYAIKDLNNPFIDKVIKK